MIRVKVYGIAEIEAPDTDALEAALRVAYGLRAVGTVSEDNLQAESDLVEERDDLLRERAHLQAVAISALQNDRDAALDDAERLRRALKIAAAGGVK